MSASAVTPKRDVTPPTASRAGALFLEDQQSICCRTDRMFAGLMLVQWLAGIGAAVWISPKAWSGTYSHIHLHVWASLLLGGGITVFPVGLALLCPGRTLTRHVIAVGQMLMSALLIHLTGGRIETHFHVFGSLAFLAFYRDWRVLISASVVVATDHFVRGVYWPQSVYGVITASPWRWLEHAGWVVFEDVFLTISIIQSKKETWNIAERQALLEATNESIEQKILARTAELRESEARKAAILESALDCVITFDDEGKVIEFNQAAERTFRYDRAEVLGRDMAELIVPPSGRDGQRRGLADYLAGGEGSVLGRRVELRARRADGCEFPVEAGITPVRLEDSLVFTAYLRDITEKKRVEALERAKEAAEAANRAKSQFLANVSHEIRTPMNGILGMSELALDTDLSGEQREYLEIVKSSADSLLTVINDILDYSRIEAGKLELDSEPFGLRDRLGGMIKMLALRAHEKTLELVLRIAPDVPDALVGDPIRLHQVLVNLIGNAIKFTERGEVVFDVATQSRAGDQVCLHFRVTDTGIGVPPEKLGLIFQPFEQADSSMTRRYGGTGLGLAICSSLVEQMGGHLWAESQQGRGSTFHFTAHFGLDPCREAGSVAERLEGLEGLPVLVVDDSGTSRRVLEDILRNWGMEPAAVDGARSALAEMKRAAASGRAYRLALIDAAMPGTDGFDLAEQLQRDAGLAGGVIMMLSSADRHDDVARCRELGLTTYVVKPVTPSDLLDAIVEVIDSVRVEPTTAAGVPRVSTPGPCLAADSATPIPRRLRILLAEDNVVNQTVATRLLEKQGHAVTVVPTGREALLAVQREAFDLVLMDVQMPDMNGFEATRAIRELEQATGGSTPIVAMTAHAMNGDEERCLEAGMDGYVSKPIHAERLLDAVQRFARASGRSSAHAPEACGAR